MKRGISLHIGYVQEYYDARRLMIDTLAKGGAFTVLAMSDSEAADGSRDIYYQIEVTDDAVDKMFKSLCECDELYYDEAGYTVDRALSEYLEEEGSIRRWYDIQRLMEYTGVRTVDALTELVKSNSPALSGFEVL